MGEFEFARHDVRFSGSLFSNVASCLNLASGERPPPPPAKLELALSLRYTVLRRRASLEAVNAWNATSDSPRVSTAYRGRDGELCLRADLRLENGVTSTALEAFLLQFGREARAFKRHVKTFRP